MLSYYDDIIFGAADRVEKCIAWLDQTFDYYAMNYAHTGGIHWRTDTGTLVWLPAPVIYWTWPHQRFAYGVKAAEGIAWDQSYVTYHGDRAARMAKQGLAVQRGEPWAIVNEPVKAREMFDELLHCLHQPLPLYAEAVHLLEGLYLLAHKSPMVLQDSIARSLDQIAHRIREKPQRNWQAGAEADRIGLSEVHFRRLFSKQVGSAFHHFVIRARLQTAAGLLRRTDLKVSAVAQACGFADVHHFTKAFSNANKRSPAAYRNEARSLGHSR